jgi:hypothetical protein
VLLPCSTRKKGRRERERERRKGINQQGMGEAALGRVLPVVRWW